MDQRLLKKFRDFSKILSTNGLKARGGRSRILKHLSRNFGQEFFYMVLRKFSMFRKKFGVVSCKNILNAKMFENV